MTLSLVLWHRVDHCQVSVARRWGLVSCRDWLQITCWSVASYDVQRDGNLWAWHWDCKEGDQWLPSHSTLTSLRSSWENGSQWFLCLRHLKKHLAGNRCWHEASCHLLAYDTWHQFLLYLDTGIGATMAQLLKCHLWLHEGLMLTISYSCRVRLKPDGTQWLTAGEVKGKLTEWVASILTLSRNVVYPALLTLMRTPWLPAVDWTDVPADLNELVHFGERRNLVSARVPSRFKRTIPCEHQSQNKILSIRLLVTLYFETYVLYKVITFPS